MYCVGVYQAVASWAETPNGLNNADQYMKLVTRCRHEQVNSLFKNWGILKQRFRGKPCNHGVVMLAIANVTQASIQSQHSSWNVSYNDA